jgi:hypothetical protein
MRNNQAGPHRPTPPCPPIDPALFYPIRRLGDWGFGARTVATMQRAGLRVLRFSKWKFVAGSDLIAFLGRDSDSISGAESTNSPGKRPDSRAGVASDVACGGPET